MSTTSELGSKLATGHYRVAQWGTGNVGTRTMRAVIEHPLMELVALRVFSPDKAGRDAGELCGLDPVGVAATLSLDELIAAAPDCLVYLPNKPDIDEICRILSAGINIATACIGFNDRASLAPGDLARIEEACRKGATSMYSTGSSPGWSTELLPITLLAMQRRLDCLTIHDWADVSSRNSPLMLQQIGFGADPASVDRTRMLGTAQSTPPTFRALARAIGLDLDSVETSLEVAVTKGGARIAAGTIPAGTVAAVRMGVTGMKDGKPLLRRYSIWYVARDLEPAWDLRDSGWRMHVEGDTSLDVSVAFDVSEDDYPAYSPGLTAHPVVNAIPHVCDAAPGLLETRDLPLLVPWLAR